jgi:regulator of protease activity HflC (stomatin/prohibitin superfamily)
MKAARIFLGVFLVALLLAGALAMMVETVPVARVGVRLNQWGGGIVEEDFEPGFHLGITGFHRWYFLDSRTHFLTFAREGSRTTSQGQTVGALEVRTKDNNLVTFDVTVTYRIIPGSGFELVQDGMQEIYRDRLVAVIEKELREQLAQLSSEDIYDPQMRLATAEKAIIPLKKEMAAYHVEPETVLIRSVSFPPEYEKKLQLKQLTHQLRLLAEAEKLVEDQGAITEKLAAEIEAAEKELRGDWDKRLQEVASTNKVTIAEILAEAEVYDKGTRATASADYETLIADGGLAVAKSEALRNELRNKALDTVGGRILLARQAAENLQFDHVTLNSNDPSIPSILDVDELVKLLVGSGKDD